MQIRPAGAEMFYADRQAGRHDEANCLFSQIFGTRFKKATFVKVVYF